MARYEMLPSSEEGYLGQAVRGIARSGARVAESVAGLPADIVQAGLGLTNLGIEKATGKESPLPKQVPFTSEFLRENITKPLTGSYLEPHGSTEAFFDDVIGDLSAIATGGIGGLAKQGGKLTLKALGKVAGKAAIVSGVGNLSSLGAKALGASEGKQTGAKIGGMLAASMFGPARLGKYISNLYNTAESNLPFTLKFTPVGEEMKSGVLSTRDLTRDLTKLGSVLEKGGETSSKKFLKENLEMINKRIDPASRTIPVDQLWELKKNVNEKIKELAKEGANKQTKGYANQLVGILNDTLKGEESMRKYPAFAKAVSEADSLERAVNQAGPISEFLSKHINFKNADSSYSLALLFHPLKTLAASGAMSAIAPLEMLAQPKNSAIRAFYRGVLESAIKEDAPAMVKYFNKLDKAAVKEYPNSKIGRYTML